VQDHDVGWSHRVRVGGDVGEAAVHSSGQSGLVEQLGRFGLVAG
jgi:hypothetical protein